MWCGPTSPFKDYMLQFCVVVMCTDEKCHAQPMSTSKDKACKTVVSGDGKGSMRDGQ